MRNLQKKVDLKTLESLDDPTILLKFLKQKHEMSDKEKEEMKKYCDQLLERINSELKNTPPTQIQELKKDILLASLGKEKIDSLENMINSIKAYFSNFNTYEARKKYLEDALAKM